MKDVFYTLRWHANKILSVSTEAKVKDLAKSMIVEITKALGEQISSEPIVTPKKPVKGGVLKGKHIAIVVGHTKKAGGAFSKYLGQNEYVYNTGLASDMKGVIESLGGTCSVHFRDQGGVKAAYAAALKTKPICMIELHYNAANGKATGAEVLFADHYDKAGIKELMLAQVVSASMANALRIKNRGAKRLAKGVSERGLQNVSQSTNIASILIESGFGDNSQIDAPAMKSRKTELARSIVDGVIKWQGLEVA